MSANKWQYKCSGISRNVDYSSSWHQSFVESRDNINRHLHMLHPSHIRVLDLCHHTTVDNQCIGQMLLIDFSKLMDCGPIDQHQLRTIINDEIDKTEDFIRNFWFTSFINIFIGDKSNFKPISHSQFESFHKSISVLVSNQVGLFFSCWQWNLIMSVQE